MLERSIQDAFLPAQIETLVEGYLTCVLIDSSLDNIWRLTFAGVHLDDAIR